MADGQSTVRLIEAIRENAAIWDSKNADYHLGNLRSDAWNRVARSVFSTYDQMTSGEQREIIDRLRQDWYKMRNRFSHNLNKKLKAEQAGLKYRSRSSNLPAEICFLEPLVRQQFAESKNNSPGADSESGSPRKKKGRKSITPSGSSEPKDEPAAKKPATSGTSPSKPIRLTIAKCPSEQPKIEAPAKPVPATPSIPKKVVNPIQIPSAKASSKKPQSTEEPGQEMVVRTLRNISIPKFQGFPYTLVYEDNDEENEFFRSLRTWTRQFNDDEKLQFRLEVMKTVEKIRASRVEVDNYVVLSRTPL